MSISVTTMSSARRWIEAAQLLIADASAVVPCPERGDGKLVVHDAVSGVDPTMMERYLVCDTCGARNVLRMRVPDLHDVVRLRRPLPEHHLAEGAIGAVVMVYKDPPAYEVEFCDSDGVTIALVTLVEADLERVPQ